MKNPLILLFFLFLALNLYGSEDLSEVINNKEHEVYSLLEVATDEREAKAFSLLTSLIEETPELLARSKDPGKIFYLRAFLFFKRTDGETEKCERFIQLVLQYPDSPYADLALDLWGALKCRDKEYEKAAEIFLKLEEKCKETNLEFAKEALYKAAFSLSEIPLKEEAAKQLKKRLYEEYPDSKYAAECYFSYYSLQEYLEGNILAIKHCRLFLKKFSKTPFLIDACYILGLDCKRDRKTLEGKWIAKKNLSFAISYFQKAENYFEEFKSLKILENESFHYVTIYYLSALEKALANLKMAEESLGGKKEIYLEYAKLALLKIIENFKNEKDLLAKLEPYPRILEETHFFLGIAYLKANNNDLAKQVFLEMKAKYGLLAITRGYFLSRCLYELGMMARAENDPDLALEFLLQSEDAAKGKILNSEQKLDLWIQQSLCYLELGQFDLSHLILSKVVNDEAISQQRLKAMFLRAFIYERQGKVELFKKQLEALSKKGGEWAVKAKVKLEEL